MRVEVKPYDDAWPAHFRAEAARLAPLFGAELMALHHIGSTAVPGLAAKPVIDMMPVVRRIEAVDRAAPDLAAMGYEGLGENGLPGRRYFRKGGAARTHQIHAYAFDHPDVLRHLAFRDFLRARPSVAKEYGRLKGRLARTFPQDMTEYVAGKDPWIRATEARALAWWAQVPLLVINGTVGVGKTTVATLVADGLAARSIPYAAVDFDALADTNIRSPWDPFAFGLGLAVLDGLWLRARALGARVLVIAGVVETCESRDALTGTVPGCRPTIVRLRAPAAVVQERLRRRMGPGASLDWHLNRLTELDAILDRAAVDDAVVETAGMAPEEVARRVLDLWRPADVMA